jgi:hypothetical protein
MFRDYYTMYHSVCKKYMAHVYYERDERERRENRVKRRESIYKERGERREWREKRVEIDRQ